MSSRFIRTNGSTSLLTFTPTRTLEYGTLMCWSRNSVGEQRDPCIFHIIAAGNILLETILTEREPTVIHGVLYYLDMKASLIQNSQGRKKVKVKAVGNLVQFFYFAYYVWTIQCTFLSKSINKLVP